MSTLIFILCSLIGNNYFIIADVSRVYDGDTFYCEIRGYPPIVGHNMPVRVYGIDSPEVRTKDPDEKTKGLEARFFARKQLEGKKVILVGAKRGKYFRLVATVLVDGKDFGQLMLDAGHAKRYIIK